jgi:hypothetical protein
MLHHDTRQVVVGADATYDESLNWKTLHLYFTWRTQSSDPGSTTTPSLSVTFGIDDVLSTDLTVEDGVATLNVAYVPGATTAGEIYAAVLERIDEINAMDLGPPIVVVGRPLLPDEAIDTSAASAGTVTSVAGSMGTLVLELVGADGSVITLPGEACVTADNWLHVSEAVGSTLGRNEVIRIADASRRVLLRT